MANCDSFLYLDYSEGSSLDGILADCARALELDDALAEARASRGLALSASPKVPGGCRGVRSAIASNPNLFEAHYFYARSCFVQGKLAEAAMHWERAAEIKPDDCQSAFLPGQVYRSLGRLKDEEKTARRGVERAERDLARHPENARSGIFACSRPCLLWGRLKGQNNGRRERWPSIRMMSWPNTTLPAFHAVLGEIDRAFDLL